MHSAVDSVGVSLQCFRNVFKEATTVIYKVPDMAVAQKPIFVCGGGVQTLCPDFKGLTNQKWLKNG